MKGTLTGSNPLPIRRSLKPAYIVSIAVALLMTAASAAGLIFSSNIYITDELRSSFLTNDVVNLLIGLPVLIVSMWLTRRGKLIGLLFWPGALFFVLYNYIVYMFGMPFSGFFLLYPALVGLSLYGTVWLISSLDGKPIHQRLSGAVFERFGGGVLIGFGVLFTLRVLALVIGAAANHTAIPRTELALHIADVILSPVCIICGVSLWRRRIFGYLAGLGLLFQASMLFIGLIVLMLLSPFVSGEVFIFVDLIVVLVMGFVCFIPFGLYVRGVMSDKTAPLAF